MGPDRHWLATADWECGLVLASLCRLALPRLAHVDIIGLFPSLVDEWHPIDKPDA
jgi:hypothetical protein